MTLDLQVTALLEKINALTPPPDNDISIEDARQRLALLFTTLAGEHPYGCTSTDLQIEGLQGHKIPVRLYAPPGTDNRALPVIVFFHGGGWSLGDIASYDNLVRSLCLLSGVIFISVGYRLAPEHKFPAGLEDALAVTRHVFDHASDFGADAAHIGVMGDSAGGNLAAVVAQKLAREGRVLAAQFLLYPALDLDAKHERYPSRLHYGDGDFMLSRDGIDSAIDWYHDHKTDLHDPALSPLYAPDVSGVAPCVMMVGSLDPLLDETRAYAQRLQESDVPSELIEVPCAIHAFLSFGILNLTRENRIVLAEKINKMLCP